MSRLPKAEGIAVKFTILGKSPAWQDEGGACSSYLVEHEETAVVVDCGNGAFGKLRQFCDYVKVDAVVLSHLHADHYFDLVPFSFALTHAPRQQPVPVPPWPGTKEPARPKLHAPPGGHETFGKMGELLAFEGLIENAFDVHEYDPDQPLPVGELSFDFRLVPHFIEAYAINITAPGCGRVTYGADCRPGPELIEVARGTDLLIAEATVPRPERDGVRGHMTPAEAGAHARQAGAKQLVLTHISDEIDPDWAVAEAQREYEGPVTIAREGDVYEL